MSQIKENPQPLERHMGGLSIFLVRKSNLKRVNFQALISIPETTTRFETVNHLIKKYGMNRQSAVIAAYLTLDEEAA